MKNYILSALSVLLISASPAFAFDQAQAKKLIDEKISVWLNKPEVIDAVKAQNATNAALTEADVKALDDKWKAGDAATIDPVLKGALSTYLKKVVSEGGGLYTEIIVMDSKGLNVGQNDKTSDFWQGDEAKWQKTFSVGPGAIDVSQVEFDESTQIYQVQVSTTIVDGGAPIGAVTVGVDAEKAK